MARNTKPRYRATMTMATYRATVRKLRAAYAALGAAIETAEYSDAERISAAMAAMRQVPDRLRPQVCKQCNANSYRPMPGEPGTWTTCRHPEVPQYDVRSGDAVTEMSA